MNSTTPSPWSPAPPGGRAVATLFALAEQGADIIAVDICADIDAIPYALASKTDLDQTVQLIHGAGRRRRPSSPMSAIWRSWTPPCRPGSTLSAILT